MGGARRSSALTRRVRRCVWSLTGWAYTEKADNNAHDIRGATKGLRVGIELLQSSISDGRFYIVDDDRYGAAPWLREVGLYCVDDHGNPVDAYNHCMDETRYANNYYYKNYVK